jgi:hypothetical protein
LTACKAPPTQTPAAARADTRAASNAGAAPPSARARATAQAAPAPAPEAPGLAAAEEPSAAPPRFSIADVWLARMRDRPMDTLQKGLMHAQRDPRTGRWQTVPKPSPTARDREPDVGGAAYELPGGKAVVLPGARIANCYYSDITTRIVFWHRQRPALDADALKYLPERYAPMADVAITQCPDRLGDALRLVLGPGFEARLAQAQANEQAKEAQEARAKDTRADAARNERQRWKQGATVLPVPRVAELARQIDGLLKPYETRKIRITEQPASRNTPATEAFAAAMKKELFPRLLELARSGYAQAQGIGRGEAGRAAFEQWERGAAGLAMSAIGRLQRLWPAGWWDVETVGAIENDLGRQYAAQLEDKSLFDAGMRTRVLQALERRRADASRKVEPPEAVSPPAATTVTRVVFLRPGELAAYKIGQDIGAGLRGLAKAAEARAKAQRMIAELAETLARSRKAFWSCWATRCAELGERYVEYSQALREKDWYYLTQHMIDAALSATARPGEGPMVDVFKTVLGQREVDGGPLVSCQMEFDRWVAPVYDQVRQHLMRNPFDFVGIAAFADKLQFGDEQRKYQRCRDATELAMRPRDAG